MQWNSGTSSSFAGFVWQNDGTITNAYTTATPLTPQARLWTAGFVYNNTGMINNAYVVEQSGNTTNLTGTVSSYNNTGTIRMHTGTGTVTGDGPVPAHGRFHCVKLNTAQATTYSSYKGFDQNCLVAIHVGLPHPRKHPRLRLYQQHSTHLRRRHQRPSHAQPRGTTSREEAEARPPSTAFRHLEPDNLDLFQPVQREDGQRICRRGHVVNANTILSSAVYKNIKGLITVTPATLTVAGVVADKTYDGTTTATLNTNVANNGLVGLVGNQTLGITYTSAAFTVPTQGRA